ncbi:N-formylglutamate amidohydrolase [Rhodobacteraceae bacterium KMM 6894]|nr:N-formylglutamate amidohydrolase [Rhodobacteraceae bacterium KMM 6894]
MTQAAYHLTEPRERTTSVVFASPHSGREYPACFLDRIALDDHTVRSSEDAYVDQLFDCAPQMGAPLLHAGAPRAFVDLNRSADELDPALIDGVRRIGHSPRVASGLGVIPRVVANGRAIYTGKIPLSEARQRIETYWRPYHTALSQQLDQSHALFGQAILIDCHSMPHEAMDSVVRKGQPRPQVVLGDRFGASAGSAVTDAVHRAFADAGLVVARNTPFAGAYVTQQYGRPARGRHAIQVEIDRALYLDEPTVRRNADFAAFQTLLAGVIAQLADIGRPMRRSLAAE